MTTLRASRNCRNKEVMSRDSPASSKLWDPGLFIFANFLSIEFYLYLSPLKLTLSNMCDIVRV